MSDKLGDRMKAYEREYTAERIGPGVYSVVRIDGRAFHTFTRGMDRPFDFYFARSMVNTASHLVRNHKPLVAYVQSDEISLVFAPGKLPFGGKVYKINSVLASETAVFFHECIQRHAALSSTPRLPSFDCRVWTVPNRAEAMNAVLWRFFDAKRNSVSMLCRAHFSHKEMFRKDCQGQINMLAEKGVSWHDLRPLEFKWGIFLVRRVVEKTLTEEELTRLPEKHRPDGPVMRSTVEAVRILGEEDPVHEVQRFLSSVIT